MSINSTLSMENQEDFDDIATNAPNKASIELTINQVGSQQSLPTV